MNYLSHNLSPFAKYHGRQPVYESEEFFASEGFRSQRSEGRRYPERMLVGASFLFNLTLRVGAFLLVQILTNFVLPEDVLASVKEVSASSRLKRIYIGKNIDLRVNRLENFLEKHSSPLSPYAQNFIWYADTYNIDWRLVPAISGVESTFAKRYPWGSYNAYGWANGKYNFSSWDHSIEVVTKTLREKYYDKGAGNIGKIARRYAPPSNTWGRNVKFFMNKIDSFPIEFDI